MVSTKGKKTVSENAAYHIQKEKGKNKGSEGKGGHPDKQTYPCSKLTD